MNITEEDIRLILSKHPNVPGISIAISNSNKEIKSIAVGKANKKDNEKLTTNHYLQCASLSKTIATVYSIQLIYLYLSNYLSIDIKSCLKLSVNEILRILDSKWFITMKPGSMNDYSENVTLDMLFNHTASLGMHYVYGISLQPLNHFLSNYLTNNSSIDIISYYNLYKSIYLPSTIDYLTGKVDKYEPIYLSNRPGIKFAYSGAGFIVLQYVIELILERVSTDKRLSHLIDHLNDFKNDYNLNDYDFNPEIVYLSKYSNSSIISIAHGHYDSQKTVDPIHSENALFPGGMLKFPSFAAGAICTPTSYMNFLIKLIDNYYSNNELDKAIISSMISDENLVDLGAIEFMRAKAGLGVFITKAGNNKLLLHQAANDGYRGVYLIVYSGPDKYKGFIVLCNGDNSAVYLQCEVATLLLGEKGLNISGIDFNRVNNKKFSMVGLKQETIVNLGLKELVLSAFINPDIDENIYNQSKL